MIKVPISPGELVDKITILALKRRHISAAAQLRNVTREHDLLCEVAQAKLVQSPQLEALWADLAGVNARLWEIEDAIRRLDGDGDFGPDFIALAQSVYRENDQRAALKRQINALLGADIVEEKSYASYAPGPERPR